MDSLALSVGTPSPAERAVPTAHSPWFRFAARRLAGLAATLVTLVVVSFLIVQLIPGDPAVALAGSDATTAEIEQLRARLGLDLPLWQQFGRYVGGLVTGDLGTSFRYGVPVAQLVAARLPFTVTVSLLGILVVLVVGVPLGMAVGVLTRGGRRRWMDAGFGATTGVLDSLPGYVLATLLVILLGTGVGLVPALPPAYTSRAPAASFVLPVIALSVGPICTVARVVRRETAVVLGEDYIRTARGWRLPAATLYLRHMLPNLLTTTLTLSGLVLSGMLGGALVIESVFALPGLGTGIIQAILDRDYPVIQGMVVVIGCIAAVITVLVDVLLGIVDPRTLGGSHGRR